MNGVDLKRGMKAVGLDPGFYLFRGRGRDEVLPWDIVDNGVSKAYYLRELDKSRAGEALAALPRDPGLHPLRRVRGDAEPVLPLPEKWKALGTSPRYLKVAASLKGAARHDAPA